jgi:hypothetical protein
MRGRSQHPPTQWNLRGRWWIQYIKKFKGGMGSFCLNRREKSNGYSPVPYGEKPLAGQQGSYSIEASLPEVQEMKLASLYDPSPWAISPPPLYFYIFPSHKMHGHYCEHPTVCRNAPPYMNISLSGFLYRSYSTYFKFHWKPFPQALSIRYAH